MNGIMLPAKIKAAVEKIKEILGTTRNPVLASNINHTYDDKFSIAAWSTSLACIGVLNIFEELGVTPEVLQKYRRHHANGKVVNLGFCNSPKATFLRKAETQIDSGLTTVEETSFLGRKSSTTKKVLHSVTEYHWKIVDDWKLFLYVGADTGDEQTVVFSRSGGTYELRVVGKDVNPIQNHVEYEQKMKLNFILNALNEETGHLEFKIDRGKDSCRTPRRNDEIESAIAFMRNLQKFFSSVHANIKKTVQIEAVDVKDKMKDVFGAISQNSAKASLAIGPVMERVDDSRLGRLMKIDDVHQILSQHKKDLANGVAEVANRTEDTSKFSNLMTTLEAKLLLVSMTLVNTGYNFEGTIDNIEHMLYKQLKDAVGKEITTESFDEYMRFHHQKLFNEQNLPKPFCYAIRRPNHYPEGEISIKCSEEHMLSSVRKAENPHTMFFALNAATNVEFGGDRFLHACVLNQFNSKMRGGKVTNSDFSIQTRARQFSSFILMIGTVPTCKKFDVKHAIIIKDKDDLKIPLIMETIPTAKEFKEAISSMSPEQQRFAKAYRKMQLSSTLFAIAVVQIKPQLEKLLNLPNDSLTKEIQLTQDLMELFIKYQIPSDLISYDPNNIVVFSGEGTAREGNDGTRNIALNQVKGHVEKLTKMIFDLKEQDMKRKAEAAVARRLDSMGRNSRSRRSDISSDSDTHDEEEEYSPMMMNARSAPKMRRGGGGRGPPPAPAPAGARPPAAFGGAKKARKAQLPRQGNSNASHKTSNNENVLDNQPESSGSIEDYTLLPSLLEKKSSEIDPTAKLRPTIIKVQEHWKKTYQKSILSDRETQIINTSLANEEKSKATDLLDALSKSGSISLDAVELHIVVASTHCFDETLIETVIAKNENPIEHIERSLLIMSSALQKKPVEQLIKSTEADRIKKYSPMLFPTLTDA